LRFPLHVQGTRPVLACLGSIDLMLGLLGKNSEVGPVANVGCPWVESERTQHHDSRLWVNLRRFCHGYSTARFTLKS
jgi:hypothetical protein